ncbi:MAG: S-layer homology domain-containing protein, partial [Oscillospiraceae bacterium]|nr:S-layer homology domain-containing protein [Oscillospiraceae bacterium]
FSRYGYRFTGWNTAADGSGTDYSDGQTVTLEVGLTLYAQWRSGGSSIPSGGSTPSAPTPTPTPTPAPAEPEAPLTEAEKDALLGEYGDLDKDAWYRDGVAFVLRRGTMNGMADGSFGPNLPASRAMIVTMLWRMEGEPAPSGSIAFEDVQGGAWYAGAVRWAASTGLVNGYSDFLFGPDDNVSREQLAVILYRYAKYKGADVSAGASLSGYADAADVSDWAGDALRWAVSNGIINGVGNNNLSPGAEAVRAQVAAMLMRYDALTKET